MPLDFAIGLSSLSIQCRYFPHRRIKLRVTTAAKSRFACHHSLVYSFGDSTAGTLMTSAKQFNANCAKCSPKHWSQKPIGQVKITT